MQKRHASLLKKTSVLFAIGVGFSFAYASGSGFGVTALAGGSVTSFDRTGQVVFPADTFRVDTFLAGGCPTSFTPALGVFYTMAYSANDIFSSIAVGLNAYYNKSSRHGSVYEYSLADFNNATYQMNIKTKRLLLDVEWGFQPLAFGMVPFVETGVGFTQNTMQFANIPRPNIGADGGYYNLSNHSKTEFAYDAGAGIKLPVNEHLLVSARYLFTGLGTAVSSTYDASTQVLVAQPLKTRVASQSILLGLSYFFG